MKSERLTDEEENADEQLERADTIDTKNVDAEKEVDGVPIGSTTQQLLMPLPHIKQEFSTIDNTHKLNDDSNISSMEVNMFGNLNHKNIIRQKKINDECVLHKDVGSDQLIHHDNIKIENSEVVEAAGLQNVNHVNIEGLANDDITYVKREILDIIDEMDIEDMKLEGLLNKDVERLPEKEVDGVPIGSTTQQLLMPLPHVCIDPLPQSADFSRSGFLPVNQRNGRFYEIKQEFSTIDNTHKLNDDSNISSMEVNMFGNLNHNNIIRQQKINDECVLHKDVGSDQLIHHDNIKIENSEVVEAAGLQNVNHVNIEGLADDIMYVKREILDIIDEMDIEDMKLEGLLNKDVEPEAVRTEKYKEALADMIQDASELTTHKENIQENHGGRGTVTLEERASKSKRKKPYECEICKLKIKWKCNIKAHLRIHSEEKPFECEICKLRFKRRCHLKAHLIIHSEEKPFECEICKFTFNCKSNLKRHYKVHTDEKPFECKICKLRFKHRFHLKGHCTVHTGEKPFACELCKRTFTQKRFLKSHLKIHTKEKYFQCEICNVKFRWKISLRKHLKIHTGEKPFECEICKLRFKKRSNLKAHLRIHVRYVNSSLSGDVI